MEQGMGASIEVRPVPGAMGAELAGVDLAEGLPEDDVRRIREALLEHHVLFFRDQALDPHHLAVAGRRFGTLERYPLVEPLPGHDEVIPVIKEPDDKANFGGGWHTDLVYRPRPSAATMLYAVEVPARGGDTLFADGVLAYEALSERMRDLLGDLRVVYNVAHVRRHVRHRSNGEDRYSRSMERREAPEVDASSPAHPLVRTHPETGVKGLYFSREHTESFEGMTIKESEALLDWLEVHMTQPVFTTRFHWRPGSLAFWDNRCVSHCALNDYPGERREMHRVTIAGDAPF
jgi:taurine dioxygenase